MIDGRDKAQQAAAVMRNWVGQTEDSWGRIFLWDMVKPACNGDAYCATGVVAAYMTVGVDLRLLFDNSFDPYDCPNWMKLAVRKGWLTKSMQEGDILLYGKPASHMGISTPASTNRYLAVEANTVSHSGGPRGVWYASRPGEHVWGIRMNEVVDYMYACGLYSPTDPLPQADGSGYEELAGVESSVPWDQAKLIEIQQRANIKVDGKWGPETLKAVQDSLRKDTE